jgi:hypothetical protein
MRTKIINDELTSDKASVIVGEEWFAKHVKLDEKREPAKFTRRDSKKPKY